MLLEENRVCQSDAAGNIADVRFQPLQKTAHFIKHGIGTGACDPRLS